MTFAKFKKTVETIRETDKAEIALARAKEAVLRDWISIEEYKEIAEAAASVLS